MQTKTKMDSADLEQWVNGDVSFLFDDDTPKGFKKSLEREWGRELMRELVPSNNNVVHWTGPLGEAILKCLLPNGWPPKKIKGEPIPDWETKHYVYEIKSQSYNGYDKGTTYEKVGIYKHGNTAKNYDKPLQIICIGYLEQILKDRKMFLGEDEFDKDYLALGKKYKIEFVWGSDFFRRRKVYLRPLKN